MTAATPKDLLEVAERHLQTVTVCVDKLTVMNAEGELRKLAGQLSRLAFRAAPLGISGK